MTTDRSEYETDIMNKDVLDSAYGTASNTNTCVLRFCIRHRSGAQHNRQQAKDARRQDNDHAGPVIKIAHHADESSSKQTALHHQEGKYGEARRRDD